MSVILIVTFRFLIPKVTYRSVIPRVTYRSVIPRVTYRLVIPVEPIATLCNSFWTWVAWTQAVTWSYTLCARWRGWWWESFGLYRYSSSKLYTHMLNIAAHHLGSPGGASRPAGISTDLYLCGPAGAIVSWATQMKHFQKYFVNTFIAFTVMAYEYF